MFKIREFESEHTCLLLHNSLSERQATKSVVGSIIVGKCAEPDVIYTPKDIQRDMLAEYGVRLTYMQSLLYSFPAISSEDNCRAPFFSKRVLVHNLTTLLGFGGLKSRHLTN